LPDVAGADALIGKWSKLRSIRSEVQKLIEDKRAAGELGSSLQAEVDIAASGDKYDLLKSLGDDLRFVFITSRATVNKAKDDAAAGASVEVSKHAKCERCWHYRADVGADPAHADLCARCVSNLYGKGEVRRYA
jgi:isoleucyl-tRNA synthetase